jgi:fumarate reductase subunit D
MGLIDVHLGASRAKKPRRAGKPFDWHMLSRSGAVFCGIMAALTIILGFLAALLAEKPGYALLGACMLCLPMALVFVILAWVLWKI